MVRRVQSSATNSRRHTITTMGDSLTFNPTLQVRPEEFWTEQLAVALRAAGATVKGRNFARNGNTTGPFSGSVLSGDMLARFQVMTQYDVPDVAVLMGGVNDPGNSIVGLTSSTVAASPAPTQTVFSVAPGLGASFVVAQAVIVNGMKGIIASKSVDAITLSAALPQVPVAGQTVRQGTQANLEWMAHTLEAAGCTRIVIVSTPFLNFSAGGDTTATPSATYQTLRTFQSAAAASPATAYTATVVYCNLYEMMRAILTASATSNGVTNPFVSPYNQVVFNGVTYTLSANAQSSPTPPDGYNWHVADSNQHLNTLGNYIVAKAVQSTIAAAGWVGALA